MRIAVFFALTACATTGTSSVKGGPRGLHADEHRAEARRQDELARQASRMPERYSAPTDALVPWVVTWDAMADHERLAAVHRSEAAALEAAYDDACGERPLAEVAVSPLVRYATGGWNTSTGVILYLSPDAGAADRLLASVKCHRAWMMLRAAVDMDACPLDLPGIVLDARGDRDAITLSISVRDPKLVPELQRRAAHELETASQVKR